jgi:DNA-binding CsgD family transcriptional regulator
VRNEAAEAGELPRESCETYLRDARLGHTILSDSAWCSVARALHLAPREMDIVRCVFDDWKEAAIAEALGISPHTVRAYLQRIYHKLQIGNRSSLIPRVMVAYLDQFDADRR